MFSSATKKSKTSLSCYISSVSSCSAQPGHPPAAVRGWAQLDKRAVSEINGQTKNRPLFSDKGTDYISTIIINKEKGKGAFGQQMPAEEQEGLNQ